MGISRLTNDRGLAYWMLRFRGSPKGHKVFRLGNFLSLNGVLLLVMLVYVARVVSKWLRWYQAIDYDRLASENAPWESHKRG